MDYIGGIEGMNFSPIGNYNQYLKGNAALNVDPNKSVDFESILNQQTQALQKTSQAQSAIDTTNFADVMNNAVSKTDAPADSAGHFLNSFAGAMNGGLENVNQKMDAANKAQEAFAMGEDVSVHDVMIAAEKAQLSFQMAMQLRNKIMTAYTELNNVKV